MSGLHPWLAIVAVGGGVVLAVGAVAAAAGWSGGRLWLDRAVLVQASTALAAALSGLLAALSGGLPADPLHLLYGAVLVGFPIGLRLVAGRRPTRRVGTWLVLGSLVVGGVLVRAFMTGG
jgi:hypothetical protein